jgi:hypothetical protein
MSIINGSAYGAINANSEGESMRRNGRVVKLDESGVRRLVREMLSEMGGYGRMSRSRFYGTHGKNDEVYGAMDRAPQRGMPDDQRIAAALAFLGPEDEAAFHDWYHSMPPGGRHKNGAMGTPQELAKRFVAETPPANEGAVKLDEAALRRLVRGMLRDAR